MAFLTFLPISEKLQGAYINCAPSIGVFNLVFQEQAHVRLTLKFYPTSLFIDEETKTERFKDICWLQISACPWAVFWAMAS